MKQSVSNPAIGSFSEAHRFQLRMALQLSHLERLRDLEEMIDFNHMLERQNPRLRDIANRLRRKRNS